MRKRFRLRSESRGKGRFAVLLALAGIILFLGLHFFSTPENGAHSGLLVQQPKTGESLLDNRGTIYDRNFKELAVTLEKVSVYADVRDVDVSEAATKLAPILDLEDNHLKDLIEKEHYRAWLAKNISQTQEEDIAALHLQGVYLHKQRVRYYPEMKSAAHIVGFVGKSMGLSGVEYTYNILQNKYNSLRQQPGAEVAEQQGSAPEPERYLLLSLDLKIQKILEKLLAELGAQRNGARIGALLMESATGKVIGAAAYPSFNPNSFQDYGWRELDNILAEPVAVPEGIRKLFWDASLIHSHGESSTTSLPWSIHSTRRSLGSQLRLWDRLGLNDPLEVDFIKANSTSAQAEPLHVIDEAMGTFDSVIRESTPLHIATALNGMLQGGVLPHPHAIEKVAGGDGKVVTPAPSGKAETVNDHVADEIRRLVIHQMRKGPLSSGSIETAWLSYTETDSGRSYTDNRMFFSAIPQEEPELVLFVFAQLPPFSPVPAETKSRFVITEPAQRLTISMVAMDKVMSTLSDMMTAEEKEEMNFQLQRHVDSSPTVAEISKAEYLGTMPDLKGYSLRKSLRHLKDLKLEIQISGTGVVVEQRPYAGQQVKNGELCRLVLKPH